MKISEFSKIIISGNIFNNTELEFFLNNKKAPRICNIYGKNGTGKSTISKGIKSNYENIIVKFKNIQNNELLREDADKIYLYNEEFIDANVKTSESGMKTIIMLGEQKDLDDQIDLLNDKRKILDKEQQRLNIEKEKFENQNDVCSPKHLKATIEHTLKSKWASRDKDIKGNIRNSTVQYDSMIKSITNNKDEEKTKEELQKEYKELLNIYTKTNNNATKINKSIDIIDKFTKNNVGLKKLLEKKIEIAEFTEREKLILSKIENGEQKFYETVRTEFSKNDIQFCPYCFQDITTIKDDIVKSISKILNKDVEEHKQELEELKAKYIVLEELDEDLNALDEKLVLEANNIIAKINEQINIYIIPKIDEKIDNIYNPIKEISTNIVELENSLNEIIKKLKDDMNKIYDATSKCDNIIIMSPIYMNQITGILKNVLDRFNPYCASENLKGKKIYLITVGQMSEEEQQEICNSIDNWFKSISEFLYFDFEYLYNFTSGDILEIDSIEKMYKKSKLDSIIENIKNKINN